MIYLLIIFVFLNTYFVHIVTRHVTLDVVILDHKDKSWTDCNEFVTDIAKTWLNFRYGSKTIAANLRSMFLFKIYLWERQ